MTRRRISGFAAAVVLLLSSASAGASDLTLLLECNVRSLRIGERARLELKILGRDLAKITEGIEGLKQDTRGPPSFVHRFDFRPEKAGRFVFGPYSLSLNGQELTSNSLSIEVLPDEKKAHGTYFRVNNEEIVLGDAFEFVIETWCQERGLEAVQLRRDNAFQHRTGGGWMRFSP